MIRKSQNSLWNDAFKRLRKNKTAMLCLIIIIGYVILALGSKFGLFFTDFNETNNAISYQAPNNAHLFGTDFMGRDVLARAAHGTLTSLTVGLWGTGLAVFIGTILGSLAGYFGKLVDEGIVWLYTTIDTIPYILLVSAFSLVLGPSLTTLCLAIGLTSWVALCRVVRAEFIKHREKEYVQAASSIGASHARRIFIHILPNVFHIILIQFSLGFVSTIKSEVILSFLGLGVEPGTPSWGVMINNAKQELARGVWWGLASATLLMFVLVLAFNLFNDALRDALDPKLKNKS